MGYQIDTLGKDVEQLKEKMAKQEETDEAAAAAPAIGGGLGNPLMLTAGNMQQQSPMMTGATNFSGMAPPNGQQFGNF